MAHGLSHKVLMVTKRVLAAFKQLDVWPDLFFSVVPSNMLQAIRGIEAEGFHWSVQPEQWWASLRMFSSGSATNSPICTQIRAGFGSIQNLTCVARWRVVQNINERDELQPLLKERVTRCLAEPASGIHVFTASSDVPDDYGLGPLVLVQALIAVLKLTKPLMPRMRS